MTRETNDKAGGVKCQLQASRRLGKGCTASLCAVFIFATFSKFETTSK